MKILAIEVYAYDNPEFIYDYSNLFLSNTIHIGATANLAGAIRDTSNQLNLASFVTSISKLNKIIFDQWFNEETILAQSIELMGYLEGLQSSNQELLDAYKRNKNDLLTSLRLLYFTGLNPIDLAEYIKYRVTEEKLRILPEVYDWFTNLSSNVEFIAPQIISKQDLITYLNETHEVELNMDAKIILHGFYFITPEQQVIFEHLKDLGFDITFLIYYKPDYPATFNFIEQFINEENGWPTVNEWKFLETSNRNDLSDVFSSMFEGKIQKINVEKKFDKYTFHNFTEFLSQIAKNKFVDLDEEDADALIMATNSGYMNHRMEEFYPDNYKNIRNFLKYPIGYLLIKLHEMWSVDNQRIEAESTQVFEIVSTRYFFKNKEEEYLLDVYKDINSFFTNCSSREEWKNQFDKLFQLRILIEEEFRMPDSTVDKYHVKYDSDYNESPFSYLPYFSVSSQNIEAIREKVKAVFDLAESLFSEQEKNISLKNHFRKLIEIVNSSDDHYLNNFLDKDLLEELRRKLIADINISEVNKDYLNDAIQFYLSGSANEDDDELVEPLINIDGELFRNRKIHITGLDEKGLPYGEYKIPWPLNEALIDKLSVKNQYLQLLITRNKSVKSMTRYLLHLMFKQANKIEFSHIQNYEENQELNASFYIDLMEDYLNSAILSEDQMINESDVIIKEGNSYNISNYPIDKKAEFLYYPNRLLYSKASKQTLYDSSFQQSFVVSRLATLLLVDNQGHEELVRKFLVDIFPQFNDLQIEVNLSNSKRYLGHHGKNLKNSEDQVSYYRKHLLFPTLKNKFDDGVDLEDLYEAAKDVEIIEDKDFVNNELIDSYIYPYGNIEYPDDYQEENDEELS